MNVKTIIKTTLSVANLIMAAVEIYDFGQGMYRKHFLKPKKVAGFTPAQP